MEKTVITCDYCERPINVYGRIETHSIHRSIPTKVCHFCQKLCLKMFWFGGTVEEQKEARRGSPTENLIYGK